MMYPFLLENDYNESIIKEHRNKLTQARLKDGVHDVLKSRGCIGRSEWHDLLVMPFMCSESHFRNISRMHPNLTVPQP